MRYITAFSPNRYAVAERHLKTQALSVSGLDGRMLLLCRASLIIIISSSSL